MDTIRLNVKLLDAPAIDLAGLAQQVSEARGNWFLKDPSAVFGDPDQVKAQAVGRVGTGPVAV